MQCEKNRIRLLAGVTLLAVMLPIVQNMRAKPVDSFPLSYYPMFSTKRNAAQKVTYLVAVDAKGEKTFLYYGLAGSGGMNQMRKQIAKSVNQKKAAKLCKKVADRVARRKTDKYSTMQRVMVVTGTHDLDRFFSGDHTPVQEEVHAACEVERRKET